MNIPNQKSYIAGRQTIKEPKEKDKGQTTIYKTQNTNSQATQTPLKTGMDSCAPKRLAVPSPLLDNTKVI